MSESLNNIPENANAHCPGPASEEAGKAPPCAGCPNQQICATAPKGPDPDLVAVAERLRGVKHKILVLSGKGGVGKSTVSSQLALALSERQFEVGLLDIDICGPSIPKMMGLEGEEVHQSGTGWSPVYVNDNLGVMSIGFMLPDPDDAVIWRGPRKNGLIKQFLKDVDWGDLDFLVIDAPPGTSDEHISIAQYLKATEVDGAVIVTTPQDVAVADVRKEISFCKKVKLPILGVVENMRELKVEVDYIHFVDAETGQDQTEEVQKILKQNFKDLAIRVEVFDSSRGGGEKLAKMYDIPFLGSVPLDPILCKASENGQSIFSTKSSQCAKALNHIVDEILKNVKKS